MPLKTRSPFIRVLAILGILILLVAAPLLIWGEFFAQEVSLWQTAPPHQSVLAATLVVALALDLLLPVPSGPLIVLAGSQLGWIAATGFASLGLMIGALFGYWLARIGGRVTARYVTDLEQFNAIESENPNMGWSLLLVTRPLPVVAEVVVLFAGLTRFPFWTFVWSVALGNLAFSALMAGLGSLTSSAELLVFAVILAAVLPYWLATRNQTTSVQ